MKNIISELTNIQGDKGSIIKPKISQLHQKNKGLQVMEQIGLIISGNNEIHLSENFNPCSVANMNRNATILLAIIKEWIKPGTTIISDCWKAYNTLNNEGYTHMTVNHSLHFKDPETGVHSNTIESSWRHSKHPCRITVVKKTFYAGYLAKLIIIYHKDNIEHENNDDTDDIDDSDDEDNYGDDEDSGNAEDEDSDGNGNQATG
ncbi:hypothetical protein QTP88_013669 [Uroleucon formosanum]